MTLALTSDDLALFLGTDPTQIDADRANLMIELAMDEAGTIVDPVPDKAKGVILSVAARGYTNPQGVSTETVGPYSVGRPWPGIYLTKAEKATLLRLAGRGGAFTVDPTPADAGPEATWYPREIDDPWWDSGEWVGEWPEAAL